ncbi:pseudouridine synthase [Nesterenkonia sp. NBAIMH1]|uniref:pseudouridine synthase n=1 Tax=Nesterenkonia sp. NBAIMH1 TaxID=2600320 RepID=UPI001FEFC0F6|nr:pseudouridine synthase [Nesterenkonia sp. NBAIMH1]
MSQPNLRRSPLPVRNGVNATRLRIPLSGPWPTVHAYVLEKFGHLDAAGITARFDAGEVVDAEGTPLASTAPLGSAEFIWYYRSLPAEDPLPVTESIIHEDDDLLVVDKPHFLPTTPAGRYVQESLLVRLRSRLGYDDLIPIHRLDRGTAGVVLLSKRPETRGAYQLMFERRTIRKTYECVSAMPAAPESAAPFARFPVTMRSRIEKTKGVVISERVPYPSELSGRSLEGRTGRRRRRDQTQGANSSSRVELLTAGRSPQGRDVGHFRLTPHTGKTHQLRLHMAMLGLGIINDRFYPDLWDDAPDDFGAPLQLLARTIGFDDPLTGSPRRFTSSRRLSEQPAQSHETHT